jgi:transposase, IS5 family
MLRLTSATPVHTLWDPLLPTEVQQLPQELALIDQLLNDDQLLRVFRPRWVELHPGQDLGQGRPTIPMDTYVRFMVVKHRYRWGYETLVREVSDSLHLRRFCLIPLVAEVPHESTIRKLTRRLGPELVDELTRGLFEKAIRERRFRPRALRPDSTVTEADIRFPTDSGLCADAVRALARSARKVHQVLPNMDQKVRDRGRAVGKRLRALGRSLRRRTGEAKNDVRRFTEEAAEQVRASVREAKRLLSAADVAVSRLPNTARQKCERGIQRLREVTVLAERVIEQIRQRFANQPIKDRLVSFADPDARPVRRGKLARPNEFGYVVQIAEVTEHTRRGARGLILPPKLRAGSTSENALLPETVAELERMNIRLREAACDAGFVPGETQQQFAKVGASVYITGTPHPGSRRTQRRLARYRVGSEGRISHVKREFGAGRTRLRGTAGARTWQGWAIFTYDLVTLARKAASRT